MPNGNIWLDTIRYRAKDSRKAMGEIFVGARLDGVKIETCEVGWAIALKRGYRVVKVDIIPQEPHP